MRINYSIIKYAPNPDQEDSFSVGLIFSTPEETIMQFSRDKINKINWVLGKYGSTFAEDSLEGLEKARNITFEQLDALSRNENGIIRFTRPRVIYIADTAEAKDILSNKFETLYQKLI